MKTLTVKLDPDQVAWLEEQARALNRSKGGIIRELIGQRLRESRRANLGHALKDLCGCLKGSPNLSSRPLKGYGRS